MTAAAGRAANSRAGAAAGSRPAASTRPRRRRPQTLLEYVAIGASAGLLGLVLLLAAAAVVVPRIAGAVPVTILTSSMKPSLPPGTLIVVKPVATNDIQVGSVITYQEHSGQPEVISHRVVAITHSTTGGLTFTTKGDNNAFVDPPVIPDQVRGEVWYSIPLLGYVNSALDQGQRSWIMPAIGILLIAYAGFHVVRGSIAVVRRRAASGAADPVRSPDSR